MKRCVGGSETRIGVRSGLAAKEKVASTVEMIFLLTTLS